MQIICKWYVYIIRKQTNGSTPSENLATTKTTRVEIIDSENKPDPPKSSDAITTDSTKNISSKTQKEEQDTDSNKDLSFVDKNELDPMALSSQQQKQKSKQTDNNNDNNKDLDLPEKDTAISEKDEPIKNDVSSSRSNNKGDKLSLVAKASEKQDGDDNDVFKEVTKGIAITHIVLIDWFLIN